jgi:hypothetical protein
MGSSSNIIHVAVVLREILVLRVLYRSSVCTSTDYCCESIHHRPEPTDRLQYCFRKELSILNTFQGIEQSLLVLGLVVVVGSMFYHSSKCRLPFAWGVGDGTVVLQRLV